MDSDNDTTTPLLPAVNYHRFSVSVASADRYRWVCIKIDLDDLRKRELRRELSAILNR